MSLIQILERRWDTFWADLSAGSYDRAAVGLDGLVDLEPTIGEQLDFLVERIARVTTATIELDGQLKKIMARNQAQLEELQTEISQVNSQLGATKKVLEVETDTKTRRKLQGKIESLLVQKLDLEPRMNIVSGFRSGAYPATELMEKFATFENALSPQRNELERIVEPLHSLAKDLAILDKHEQKTTVWNVYLPAAKSDFEKFKRWRSQFEMFEPT